MVFLALVYSGLGLLFVGLAVPLIQQRVPPNSAYGYRVPQTVHDPSLWYPVNAYAGRLLCGVGLMVTPIAVLLALVPGMRPETYVIIMSTILVVGTLLMAVLGWVYPQRLLRERS